MSPEDTSELDGLLDTDVDLDGTAYDTKAGAVLVLPDETTIYIEGLSAWPRELSGKAVAVRGRLTREKVIQKPETILDGLTTQGAEGDQLLLSDASWEPRAP